MEWFSYSMVAVIILGSLAFSLINKRKKEDSYSSWDEENDSYETEEQTPSASTENVSTKVEENKAMKDLNTLQLVYQTLEKIGCQPKIVDDERIKVSYQGENFEMLTIGPYIRIYDLGWSSLQTSHPDYALMREAINATNFDFGPHIVCTEADEEGNVYIHSLHGLLFIDCIPDIEAYLRQNLQMFFNLKQSLFSNIAKLKQEKENLPIDKVNSRLTEDQASLN